MQLLEHLKSMGCDARKDASGTVRMNVQSLDHEEVGQLSALNYPFVIKRSGTGLVVIFTPKRV